MSKYKNKLNFLGHLTAFEAAARLGSFSLAARSLGISRTAVSYQIKEMEIDLGKPLFHRLNRAVQLTIEGEKLYVAAGNALETMLDAATLIRDPAGSHHLAVTTTSGFANFWLLPRLSSFRQQYPDIDLNLVISDEYIDLEDQSIDVAIRYLRNEQKDASADFLLNHSIAPTCSANMLTRLSEDSSAPNLVTERLIYLESARYDQRSKWLNWFKSKGINISKLPNGISVNDYVNLIRMCEAGEGWALLGSPLIDPQLKAGTLHQPLRIEQLVIGRFVIKRRQDGEVVNLFCTWLSRQANDSQAPQPVTARTTEDLN